VDKSENPLEIVDTEDDKEVPHWCTMIMEAGIWSAFIAAFIAHQFIDHRTTLIIVYSFVSVSAAMWLLHAFFLRRSIIYLPKPVLIVLALFLAVTFVRGDGDDALSAIARAEASLCILVLVIVSGVYTENQINRLLATLGMLGVMSSFFVFHQKKNELIGDQQLISGVIDGEWEIGSLLIISAFSAGAFAVRSFATGTPVRQAISIHSRIAWFSSPGANQALLGALSSLVIMMAAFRLESLFIFPVLLGCCFVFGVAMGVKQKIRPPIVIIGLAVVLTLWFASLARPLGLNFNLNGTVFKNNWKNMTEFNDVRARHPSAVIDSEGVTQTRRLQFDESDWADFSEKAWFCGVRLRHCVGCMFAGLRACGYCTS